MSFWPKIETVKSNSDTTILVYFDTGIIKTFDLKPFLANTQNGIHADIKLNPEGIKLNDKIDIGWLELWTKGKFFGWDKQKLSGRKT